MQTYRNAASTTHPYDLGPTGNNFLSIAWQDMVTTYGIDPSSYKYDYQSGMYYTNNQALSGSIWLGRIS